MAGSTLLLVLQTVLNEQSICLHAHLKRDKLKLERKLESGGRPAQR